MATKLAVMFLLGGIAASGPLKAGIIQLNSAQDLNMQADELISIPGNAGTYIPSPLTFSSFGETVTVSQSSGLNFLMVFAGDPMPTNFLYNDAIENNTPSPMSIQFSVPLVEFGVQVVNNSPTTGNQVFTFNAYLGATLEGTFTVTGPSTSASFFGITGTNGTVFNRITISSNSDDFAVCACQIAANPAPEPGSVFYLAGGGLVIGLFAAKSRLRG